MFYEEGELQSYNGKMYATNEVGGIDIFISEPVELCPICTSKMTAEFCDNGFGPYAVQISPWFCEECYFTGLKAESDPTSQNLLDLLTMKSEQEAHQQTSHHPLQPQQ